MICVFFFFLMSEESILTKKIQKKKKNRFVFMFWFVICVSESVVVNLVISGCKIDFLFFLVMIGSYWATTFD